VLPNAEVKSPSRFAVNHISGLFCNGSAKYAQEDGPLLSFFIVNEMKGRLNENLFVSPDWPSAEAFAKNRIALLE
jgi:hypothetical protein